MNETLGDGIVAVETMVGANPKTTIAIAEKSDDHVETQRPRIIIIV